jgi:3-hydroxyacyl-[acyl-carrier-protein] dehydratase
MRYILVDRITDITLGESAKGLKNVSQTEDMFDQHFPGLPVMPGCMILEAFAQLSGLLVTATLEFRVMPMLLMVDRAKFRRVVQPGDQLIIETKLLSMTEGGARLRATATVAGPQTETRAPRRGVAEAVLTLALFPLVPERAATVRGKFDLLMGLPYNGLGREP